MSAPSRRVLLRAARGPQFVIGAALVLTAVLGPVLSPHGPKDEPTAKTTQCGILAWHG